ncbi:MAG: ATP synthase F1 subunit epsilon [Bdellovibrionales bacterium]|nr:ATP synthase F1 subunit epsilon [Bdellovibrionales bacterium]
MADTFTLRVCTPKGIFLEQEVSEVTIPSELGEIGILPGHTSYTGLLGVGVLQYVEATGKSAKRLVVAGGFISHQNNSLLILTDVADSSETVDRDGYAGERKELQKYIETERTDTLDWQRAKASLQRVEAIDELISN